MTSQRLLLLLIAVLALASVLALVACDDTEPTATHSAIPTATPTQTATPTTAPSLVPTAIPTPTQAVKSTATPEPTPVVLGDCLHGMKLDPGDGCRYTGGGSLRAKVVLSVLQDGSICREGGPAKQFGFTINNLRLCTNGFERDEAFGSDIAVRKNPDGSWTFYGSSSDAASSGPQTPTLTPVPSIDPVSLSEFNDASSSERETMLADGRIHRCRAGLALPLDSFCIDESATSLSSIRFLVGHLPEGDGLVLQGSARFQVGENAQLGWITYEKEGSDRVITHLEPANTAASAPESPTATPTATPSPLPTAPADGICRVGLTVRSGEICTYPGTSEDFSVASSGRGRFLFFTAGTGIEARNTTVNGVTYNFKASKQSDGSWIIEAVGGDTPAPSTATATPATPSAPTATPTATPTPELAPAGVLIFIHELFGIHVELKVLEVERGYAGNERSTFWLEDGNEWVRVVIEVKNLGEDKYSSFSRLNFALVDANGSELGDTFGAPDTGNLIWDKEIAQGANVRGDVVLQAPISESYLALEVNPTHFSPRHLPLTGGPAPQIPTPTPAPPTATPTPAPPWAPRVRVVDRDEYSLTISLVTRSSTYFELRRRDEGSREWTALGKHDMGNIFIDDGLVADSTYYYSARACNDAGCSAYSDQQGGITEASGEVEVPSTPVNIVATRTRFVRT